MKSLWLLTLACTVLSMGRADDSVPAMSAGELLDQAIHWPGDYKYLGSDNGWDENPPPIPCYGLSWSVAMPFYLSDRMKGLLHDQRDAVIKELVSRFVVFDWLNQPPILGATKVPKVPLKVYSYPPGYDGPGAPMPTEPTGDNPRGMGQLMLSIVLELKAVETLPELLRIEAELNQILENASRSDKAPLPNPDFELLGYDEALTYRPMDELQVPKVRESIDRAQRLFRGRLMDAQMLGAMLELLHERKCGPLGKSVFERVRVRDALHETRFDDVLKAIHRVADIPKDKPWIRLDEKTGIAYNTEHSCHFRYSKAAREEIRALVVDYLSGKVVFHEPNGDALLDEAIERPGCYWQMCATRCVQDDNSAVPLPAYGPLIPQCHAFSAAMLDKLLTYRDQVVPAAIARLRATDLTLPQPQVKYRKEVGWPTFGSQRPKALSLQFLSVLRVTRATEALQELWRLEGQLHNFAIKGAKNEHMTLPAFDLTSPYKINFPWKRNETAADDRIRKTEVRSEELFKIQVMDHEILRLMAGLLRKEHDPGLHDSQIEKDYITGLRAMAAHGELRNIKKASDIPLTALTRVRFDEELKIPLYRHDPADILKYTEARREEVRTLVQKFLTTVPEEDWSGPIAPALPRE